MPGPEVEKKKKFRSLAANLAKIFLFLVLGVILISNGLQLYLNFRAQQQIISSQQYLIAENAADSVRNFIQQRFSMLETAASVSLAAGVKEEQKNVIDKLLGREPSFRHLALLDKEGRKFIEVSRLSAAAPGKLESRFENDLFDLVKQGKRYFGSVYIDEITSEPMAIMAVPIRDVFGDFQGTLVAEVNLKFMWDLVGGIKVGNKGVAYVVDKKGNLIAFGDISRVLKEENLANLEEVDEFMKSEESPNAAATNKLDITKGIQNTNIVSSYVSLGLPDWAVVVELPATEAYQGIIYQFGFTLLIIILTVGLGSLSGVYISKIITKPIISLRNVAEEISRGNLKARAEIKSQDEIGQLSSVFNYMASRLTAYTGELESKVAERTAELAKKLKELAESNTELEKTQSAMLNLLEDARVLEQDLKEERDRIETIVSSMAESLIVVDKENRIVLMNPAAEKTLEISLDKSRGQDITKVVPLYRGDKHVAFEEHPIVKAIKSGKAVITKLEDDFYFQASSGRKFAVIMVMAPLFGEGISGAVMVFRDVTEEKQLDEAKSGFISIASHQLRTPLTSMRWFSEMLIDGDVGRITNEQKHFVERIYEGTDRMIGLVNLLLQISRVEAGRLKIEPALIDFKAITQGVLVSLHASIDQKFQNVVVKCNPDPFPQIPMDKEVVWQVIQNLVSNANRYSPEKGVIDISIVKKGDMAEYSVKDQGIGIPKDQQKRIFEKFYRAENALKYVPTGSGLGLSLVKLLVENWGGKIWFETEENKGSTFYFTVPLSGMEPKTGEVGITV